MWFDNLSTCRLSCWPDLEAERLLIVGYVLHGVKFLIHGLRIHVHLPQRLRKLDYAENRKIMSTFRIRSLIWLILCYLLLQELSSACSAISNPLVVWNQSESFQKKGRNVTFFYAKFCLLYAVLQGLEKLSFIHLEAPITISYSSFDTDAVLYLGPSLRHVMSGREMLTFCMIAEKLRIHAAAGCSNPCVCLSKSFTGTGKEESICEVAHPSCMANDLVQSSRRRRSSRRIVNCHKGHQKRWRFPLHIFTPYLEHPEYL
eukprot:284814860_2